MILGGNEGKKKTPVGVKKTMGVEGAHIFIGHSVNAQGKKFQKRCPLDEGKKRISLS